MKRLFTIILSVILLNVGSAQQISVGDEIDQLYKKVDQFQKMKDYNSLINALLKILEIDPDQFRAKHYLIAGVKSYFNDIKDNEFLLNQSLKHIREFNALSKMPLTDMIQHYYNTERLVELRILLMEIVRFDTAEVKIQIDPLFRLNRGRFPDIYDEILASTQPFIDKSELSAAVLFSIYLDSGQKLDNIIGSNNIVISDIVSCEDTTTLIRLLELYLNRDTVIASPILDEMFESFQYCFEQISPLKLSNYYYYTNQNSKLLNLLDKIEQGSIEIKSDSYNLEYFDLSQNPTLGNRIISLLIDKISVEEIPQTNIIPLLFKNQLFGELDHLLKKLEESRISLRTSFQDYTRINVASNPLMALRIYRLYYNNLNEEEFRYSTDAYLMYRVLKQLYFAKLFNVREKLIKRISELVSLSEYDYKMLGILGISSLLSGDDRIALRIFSQITNLGLEDEKGFLLDELRWWDNIIQSEIIKMTLASNSDVQNNERVDSRIDNRENKETVPIKSENNSTLPEQATYHALLIGIKDYNESKLDLVYPIIDVHNLAMVLEEKYSFDQKNIKILENPTRADIFRTLIDYRNTLGDNDNLLVFYAGHGWWDEDMEQGYWFPSNAESTIRVNWISNSEITEYIRSIKTKHTLLISDACFSGSIFKTRSLFVNDNRNIEKIYKKQSRKAITSGTLVSVQDKSVFIEYLIKKLNENEEILLPAEKLYLNFRDAVTNNSINKQRPLYGEIWNSGDEGGDFIFVKKQP